MKQQNNNNKHTKEEEVRAKHQAALFAYREKAIIDKAKAEIALLRARKKSLVEKPCEADDKKDWIKRLESERVCDLCFPVHFNPS